MNLDPKLVVPTVVGAFLVLVIFLFWYKGQAVTNLPANHPSSATVAPPGGSDGSMNDAPSKDNVNHTFLAEENRLRMAIEESPSDTTSMLKLARFYHDAHKLQDAITIYDQYLALHADNKQAWADLADCYVGLGNMDGARIAMETALSKFPDNPMMLYNLGAIHANMGQFDKAKLHWSRVRDLGGDDTVKAMAVAGLEKIR